MNFRRSIAAGILRLAPGPEPRGRLQMAGGSWVCAIGAGRFSAAKREGDGATPVGLWPLREVLYRPDRIARPRTGLPARPLRRADGWCDAPADRNYNRPVRHPYAASAERLWRQDGLYDLVVVIGYNDRPRVRGRGSAIFLHVARPGLAPTEGCVALPRDDLLRLVRRLRRGDSLRVLA
jgi:L,D-peptidoglycan transpeptidase YkuD (ErfK/YbiS/YcfS/YnhG family)